MNTLKKDNTRTEINYSIHDTEESGFMILLRNDSNEKINLSLRHAVLPALVHVCATSTVQILLIVYATKALNRWCLITISKSTGIKMK